MPSTRSSHSPFPGLALIAAIVALVALAFAWVGGWLSPGRIGGGAIANSLEYNAGRHPGWRRAQERNYRGGPAGVTRVIEGEGRLVAVSEPSAGGAYARGDRAQP